MSSSTSSSEHPAVLERRFTRASVLILASFGCAVALMAANFLFLLNANELVSADEAVRRQQDSLVLYNGLKNRLADYKLAAYRHRKPEIVVLGSSRAMQFRSYHFTKSFYNLSGVGPRPENAGYIVDQLLRIHRPELVIYVLDFWHYCETGEQSPTAHRIAGFDEAEAEATNWLLIPSILIKDGKLSLADFVSIATGVKPTRRGGVSLIGISAVLQLSGFADDGSRYTFLGHRKDSPLDRRWRQALQRIRAGASNFMHGCRLSHGRIELLHEIAEKLEAAGVRLVLMIAPLPDVTLKAMRAAGHAYAYIDEWRDTLERNPPAPVFDFQVATRFGSPDCEFRDGFHGGEVTYIRLLREAARRPANPLRAFVDAAALTRLIETHRGRLTVAGDRLGVAFATSLANEATCEHAPAGPNG